MINERRCIVVRNRGEEGASGAARPRLRTRQPVRAIEDLSERHLEQVIRRVLRAPVSQRLYEIRHALASDVAWPLPGGITHLALPFGENYVEYMARTAGEGTFLEWALTRIFSDPRIAKELRRPGVVVLDPLLRAEAKRCANDSELDRTRRSKRAAADPAPVIPFRRSEPAPTEASSR